MIFTNKIAQEPQWDCSHTVFLDNYEQLEESAVPPKTVSASPYLSPFLESEVESCSKCLVHTGRQNHFNRNILISPWMAVDI